MVQVSSRVGLVATCCQTLVSCMSGGVGRGRRGVFRLRGLQDGASWLG